MTFPNIESLGLEVQREYVRKGYGLYSTMERLNFILAEDLELLLEKATIVYGFERSNGQMSFDTEQSTDTHQAILLNIKPIEKKCEKHEPVRYSFHATRT